MNQYNQHFQLLQFSYLYLYPIFIKNIIFKYIIYGLSFIFGTPQKEDSEKVSAYECGFVEI
jgi:NADH:ubiquinone oxidoreductase subunit 3 (subunit A)